MDALYAVPLEDGNGEVVLVEPSYEKLQCDNMCYESGSVGTALYATPTKGGESSSDSTSGNGYDKLARDASPGSPNPENIQRGYDHLHRENDMAPEPSAPENAGSGWLSYPESFSGDYVELDEGHGLALNMDANSYDELPRAATNLYETAT